MNDQAQHGSVFVSKEVFDLRNNLIFLDRYVNQRNRFSTALLTEIVDVEETASWLVKSNVLVHCLAEKDKLLGAAILYCDKDGEIAVFTDTPRHGVATALLRSLEAKASNEGLKRIWAWTSKDNLAAQGLFKCNGFNFTSYSSRNYRDSKIDGLIFEKMIMVP